MALDVPKFKLLSGNTIPLIGLGSYLIDGRNTEVVLDRALSAGYRMIDTAAMYGNEHDLGSALKVLLPKHNLERKDIFITSKLAPGDHGTNRAKKALKQSVKNLQCDYLDLYLIHWPGVYGNRGTNQDHSTKRAESWQALIEGREEGLVRDIGVSNYTTRHLNELLENCHGTKPALNQVEWHPGCHDLELQKLCEREGILVQAYMSLGGSGNESFINDPLVVDVARRLSKEPAQVLLRWSLQQNVGVIPKARSLKHLQENIDLNFVIAQDDMDALSSKKKERLDWDPTFVN